jgi:hypothetical protein
MSGFYLSSRFRNMAWTLLHDTNADERREQKQAANMPTPEH